MTLTLRMTDVTSTVQFVIQKVGYSGLTTLKTAELSQGSGKRNKGQLKVGPRISSMHK